MSLEIFISYAHKDHKLRDELAAHLATLRNQHIITDWFVGMNHLSSCKSAPERLLPTCLLEIRGRTGSHF